MAKTIGFVGVAIAFYAASVSMSIGLAFVGLALIGLSALMLDNEQEWPDDLKTTTGRETNRPCPAPINVKE